MQSKVYFSESTLPEDFSDLVELNLSLRRLVVLLEAVFNELLD